MTTKQILTLTVAALAMMLAGCGDDSGSLAPTNGPAGMLGAAIPEGAVIESATLNLYVWQVSDQTVNAHRVTADWDEMTVTWNNFGGAYDAAVEASLLIDAGGYLSFDVTALVQAWLDGTYPNYGFLLEQGTTYPRSIFISREHADVNMHPVLEVCYMDGGQVVCEGLSAIADAYFWELNPDDNAGDATTLRTGWGLPTDWEKQSLIRFELPETPPPSGCVSTIGFWKTHAGFGPQADAVTPLLPIWLGDAGGTHSLLVPDAQTAVDVLKMKTYGSNNNGITKLYAQLLGAKLNFASGATNVVGAWVAEADAFLAAHDHTYWDYLDDMDDVEAMQAILDLKDIFDDYNNGDLGVDHCD